MSNLIRVLYVDDNPLDRELVRDALVKEHGGFTLTEAASRSEFEARLAALDCDVVLSDFNILGFQGLQVLEAVHAQDPQMPVVIVTGTGSEEVAVEAVRRGAADYVVKTPQHIRRLPRTIQAVLEHARLETERKRAEEALRQTEALHRTILRTAMEGFWRADTQGRLLDVNDAYCRMSGYSREELLGMSISDVEASETPAEIAAHIEKIRTQGEDRFESKHRRKDGSTYDVEVSAQYKADGGGQTVVFLRDITERKRAEEALKELLREKESLLKEVHHRVKNNLQVISSLIRLQSAQVDNPVARAALREMQNRIGSMALLHETLYQSGNFARVDLAAYLGAICSQLYHSLVVDPESIQLRMDVASASLDVNQAVPCGLLVNELVSNCLKHAFPQGGGGEIRVELHPVGDGPALCLRVADNGVGLPADFDLRQPRSLGLQIVSDLVGQLQGRLEFGRGPGAVFEVVFTP